MTAVPFDAGATASSPAGSTVTPPHILLVDDEAVVSRSVAKLIERLGYRVTVVDSGTAALELVARERFDLVVTDQNMPGMTGAELIASLVSRGNLPADRIILTSGDIQSPETQRLLASARCRFLEKPFHIHDLATALRAIVPPVKAPRPG